MGLRETMNQNPRMVTGVTAGIILLALIIVGWQLLSSGSGTNTGATAPNAKGVANAFFTTDDGKTWFADDAAKFPPFDKDGKPAYSAILFTCDGGKTQFVGYLQRYTPERKKHLESSPEAGAMAGAPNSGVEFKAPLTGDTPKNWIKPGGLNYTKLVSPKCPGGGDPEVFLP